MRYTCLLALVLAISACGDDDSDGPASAGKGGSHSAAGASGSHHAGSGGGRSGGSEAKPDGGVAGENASKLERPGMLPRPPKTGLPADLRPPH